MQPVLIRFSDSFFIATYGFLIALGLLAATMLAAFLGRRQGIRAEVFLDLAFVGVLSGFIGGRVLFILLDFRNFLQNPADFIFSRTGFVFLGGLLTAVAVCTWYVQRKKQDFWRLGDIAVASIALAHAFGRIGCHFSGCCFGKECHSPFGIEVPRVIMPGGEPWPNVWWDHFERGLVGADSLHSLPVWPVQLMESASLFLLATLLVLLHFWRHRKGLMMGLYLALYAVIRFLLEMLRGDEERGEFFGGALSTSQGISILLFLAGVAILATLRKREAVEGIPLTGGNLPAAEEPEEVAPAAVTQRRKRKGA